MMIAAHGITDQILMRTSAKAAVPRQLRCSSLSAKVTSKIGDLPLPAEWWWKPAELLTAVDVYRQRFQCFEDMHRRDLKQLREAWAASRFANILSRDRPVFIRLESDRFPDFTLRVHEEILQFELTDAYQEGRRLSEEYRCAAARKARGLPPVIELSDPAEEEEAAIPAIVRAIEKKAKKRYSPPPHLLVHVTFSCVTDEPPITSLQAFQLADRWSKDFKSCWLLWDHCIFRLWPRAAKIRDQ